MGSNVSCASIEKLTSLAKKWTERGGSKNDILPINYNIKKCNDANARQKLGYDKTRIMRWTNNLNKSCTSIFFVLANEFFPLSSLYIDVEEWEIGKRKSNWKLQPQLSAWASQNPIHRRFLVHHSPTQHLHTHVTTTINEQQQQQLLIFDNKSFAMHSEPENQKRRNDKQSFNLYLDPENSSLPVIILTLLKNCWWLYIHVCIIEIAMVKQSRLEKNWSRDHESLEELRETFCVFCLNDIVE